MKKLLALSILSLTLVGCWGSETKTVTINKTVESDKSKEGAGEKMGRAADDIGNGIEDFTDGVEEATD